ncbi:Dynein light chain type [Fasciolopsis buskii]|uniref:Dynein light chain n=1 Tax=Fasciolopsis buskii TaxID=27845 RepID=A0A8E0RUB6_9TREM|nr:Dynein light chain type [Fasciolopsis buski]
MEERRAIVEGCTMNDEMLEEAVTTAVEAMEKFDQNRDVATYIKRQFDKKYNATWHCIVGRDYGSFISHEAEHFVDFRLGDRAVLLYRTC